MYGIKVVDVHGTVFYVSSSSYGFTLSPNIEHCVEFVQESTVIKKIKEYYKSNPKDQCSYFTVKRVVENEVPVKRVIKSGYVISYKTEEDQRHANYYYSSKTKKSESYGDFRYSYGRLIGDATRFKTEADAIHCMNEVLKSAHHHILSYIMMHSSQQTQLEDYVSMFDVLRKTISVHYHEDK